MGCQICHSSCTVCRSSSDSSATELRRCPLKFVLAERFSAPFCRPKLPPKFVLAERFSAPFSAFFAFALLPPLLPHPSSLAFLGFSVAIILVPAKALASGPLSRFRLLFPLSGFFSSPFLIFPCHNFGAGEGFSLGAALALSPLFCIRPKKADF